MPDASLEKLASLRTSFKKEGGTVTAGNASGLNDAAACVVMMSKDKADELGKKPLARVVEYAAIGCEPEIMGVGPIYAVDKVLKKAGMTLDDIDVIELNEAFAAQAYYCVSQIGLPAGEDQHLRLRRGPGAPGGSHRLPHRGHLHLRPEGRRRQVRPGHHVHRRRPGHGHDHRAALIASTAPRA